MSCRTTSGGSVSTSLARMVSGLPDKDIQHLFHALKREGAGQPAPSELALADWRERQQQMLDRATRLTDKRRDALRRNLFRSREEPVPDGAMFYAWSRIEARARQEAVIRSIDTAVDLEPPGSQADQYELGEDGRPVNVMYASYGSNLHRDRFMKYIEGGTPPGSRRNYPGCTDPSEPEFDIPIRYHGGFRAHFALTSSVWRGGIAFMDKTPDDDTATALGRAYKLPIGTFDEVVHFENGGFLAKTARPVPLDEVLATGRSVTGDGVYETMVHIGDYQGMPVITFTAPFSTHDALTKSGSLTRNKVRLPVMTNKPSAAYCRMIGTGLQETFGMSEVAAADYLRGMPGAEKWSRADMVAILREPEAPATPAVPEKTVGYTSATLPAFSRREGSPTYLGQSDVKSWIEQQHAANGQPRRTFGNTNTSTASPSETPVTSRWSLLGTEKPDADGNYLPAVKTYTTVSEQEDGVVRWNHTLQRAKDKVTADEAMLTYYESKNLTVSTSDARDDLARSQAVLAEAKAKHAAAKTQTPASFYPETSAYYPHQWNRMAERVGNDLRKVEADLYVATRAKKPSAGRIRNLKKKKGALELRVLEAQTKAREAAAGSAATTPATTPAVTSHENTRRSPSNRNRANTTTSTSATADTPSSASTFRTGPRPQPGQRYRNVQTYPTIADQIRGVKRWQSAVHDTKQLHEHQQARYENALARHTEQPSPFSDQELAAATKNLAASAADHTEAVTKRDKALAQTPATYNGSTSRTALRTQATYLALELTALEDDANHFATTAHNPNNDATARQRAQERLENITHDLTLRRRALTQINELLTQKPRTSKTA